MSLFSKLFGVKTAEIEKAKQGLIADLETKGMRYLVEQMGNRDLYSPKILETRDKSVLFNSEDTISWYAFRRADNLRSPDEKNELLQLLSDPAYAERRIYIYTCLSTLCSNAQDLELFEFLMQAVEKEKDKHIISSILGRLEDLKKPATANIAPIKKLLTARSNEIRVTAGKALAHTNDPEVEELMLKVYEESNTHVKTMFCSTLGTIGTSRSIGVLRASFKKTRDYFFRDCIERAISAIEKRGE